MCNFFGASTIIFYRIEDLALYYDILTGVGVGVLIIGQITV